MKTVFKLQSRAMFILGFFALVVMFKESTIPVPCILQNTIFEDWFAYTEYREITFSLSCSLLVGFMVWLFDSYIPKASKFHRRKKQISNWLVSTKESQYFLIRSLNSYAKVGGYSSYKDVIIVGDNDSKYAVELNVGENPKVKLYDINEALASLEISIREIQKCEDIFNYETNENIDNVVYQMVRSNATIVGEEYLAYHRQFLRLRSLVYSLDKLLSSPQLKRT
ncbi:hypothetical protein [Vibrio diabolicus]|uniref:hypothetical protein n=1 Tax=Vibrio diabolicus TaxID=50719 RepID=UPI00193BA55D|nr:hypothetical protein [Vibrio diabolicus]